MDKKDQEENKENKQRVVLDLTTIITLISDITNDKNIGERFGDIKLWIKFNKNIYKQILDEEVDPVIHKLKQVLSDKIWCMTKLSYEKLQDMIGRFGSKGEIDRMKGYLPSIEVIEDIPSQEFLNLDGKIWTPLNKNIFGTADKMQLLLVTGNLSAVKSLIEHYGRDDLPYIAHRSRCFVGERLSSLERYNEYLSSKKMKKKMGGGHKKPI